MSDTYTCPFCQRDDGHDKGCIGHQITAQHQFDEIAPRLAIMLVQLLAHRNKHNEVSASYIGRTVKRFDYLAETASLSEYVLSDIQKRLAAIVGDDEAALWMFRKNSELYMDDGTTDSCGVPNRATLSPAEHICNNRGHKDVLRLIEKIEIENLGEF